MPEQNDKKFRNHLKPKRSRNKANYFSKWVRGLFKREGV